MDEISHPGIVAAVGADTVTVVFERQESCGNCRLQSVCNINREANRQITVPVSNAAVYRVGQKVELILNGDDGWRAALLAYGLPLLLVWAALGVTYAITGNETAAAAAAFVILPLYYLGLRFYSKKLGKRPQIRIR